MDGGNGFSWFLLLSTTLCAFLVQLVGLSRKCGREFSIFSLVVFDATFVADHYILLTIGKLKYILSRHRILNCSKSPFRTAANDRLGRLVCRDFAWNRHCHSDIFRHVKYSATSIFIIFISPLQFQCSVLRPIHHASSRLVITIRSIPYRYVNQPSPSIKSHRWPPYCYIGDAYCPVQEESVIIYCTYGGNRW